LRTTVRAAGIVAGTLLALVLGITPSAAVDNEIDPRVAAALADLPGGVSTSAETAEWPQLGITFSVSGAATRSVSGCATGTICAYSRSGLGGSVTTYSGCSSWPVVGGIGSIANSRTSGWVDARSSTGINLRRIGYGNWADVPTTTKTIACGGSGISY
jgi:hypothetical protein